MPPAIRNAVRAEKVYQNGRIYTLDPARPVARAIALRHGRIIAVGTDEEVRAYVDHLTEVYDLEGRTVVPGFVDAHCHPAGLGFALENVPLQDTRSFEEVVQRARARLQKVKPGDWVLGRGWNQEHWAVKEFPTHHRLSEISPDNPVWFRRVDGHAGIANRKAMELAKITRDTPNPPGGEILRGADGEPTGVLIDNAMELIERVIPDPSVQQIKQRLLAAQEACLAFGQTELHDAGAGPDLLRAYAELAAEEKLKIRFYVMIGGSPEWILKYIRENSPQVGTDASRLTVRSIKMYLDGALGSRGAWLLEPYEDRPGHVGLPLVAPDSIRTVALEALKRGWQLCVHAIGDRANREVLNAFEAALREVPVPDHRFRVEHAQITHPDDIRRFAGLGVIPSMQPTHATSDMWMAEKRLGRRRLTGAYAWRKFLDAGCRIAGGSDFPVESHNPLLGFYAAVTRQDAEGRPEGGWLSEERLTREEALRCFTVDACRASFEEKVKGVLRPGMYADFVVLSRDIMTCPPQEILTAEVLRTVINGETAYCR